MSSPLSHPHPLSSIQNALSDIESPSTTTDTSTTIASPSVPHAPSRPRRIDAARYRSHYSRRIRVYGDGATLPGSSSESQMEPPTSAHTTKNSPKKKLRSSKLVCLLPITYFLWLIVIIRMVGSDERVRCKSSQTTRATMEVAAHPSPERIVELQELLTMDYWRSNHENIRAAIEYHRGFPSGELCSKEWVSFCDGEMSDKCLPPFWAEVKYPKLPKYEVHY